MSLQEAVKALRLVKTDLEETKRAKAAPDNGSAKIKRAKRHQIMARHPTAAASSKKKEPAGWGGWLSSSSMTSGIRRTALIGGTGEAAQRRRLQVLLLLLLLPALHFFLGLLAAGQTHTHGDTAASSPPSPSSSSFLQALKNWAPLGASAPAVSSSSSSLAPSSEVAIVMVDTRDLLAVPEYQWYEEGKLDPFWYGVITAAMNHEYACQQGYDFLFYHIHPEATDDPTTAGAAPNATSHFLSTPLEGEVATTEGFDKHYQKTENHDKYLQGCRSPADNGELRSSPWCKVAVLDRVLQLGYKYAVIIDTDALFVDMERGIPQLLDEYVDPARRLEQGGAAGVFISNDKPFRAHRVNSGFIIAQASPEAQRFLRAWWDTPSGEWLTRSPFEQEVLNLEREAGNNTVLLENGEVMDLTLMLHGPYDAKGDMQVVGYRVLNPHNLPALHVTEYDRFLRDQIFSLLYAKQKIINERRHQRFTHACPAPRRITLDGTKEPIHISTTPYPAAAAT